MLGAGGRIERPHSRHRTAFVPDAGSSWIMQVHPGSCRFILDHPATLSAGDWSSSVGPLTVQACCSACRAARLVRLPQLPPLWGRRRLRGSSRRSCSSRGGSCGRRGRWRQRQRSSVCGSRAGRGSGGRGSRQSAGRSCAGGVCGQRKTRAAGWRCFRGGCGSVTVRCCWPQQQGEGQGHCGAAEGGPGGTLPTI